MGIRLGGVNQERVMGFATMVRATELMGMKADTRIRHEQMMTMTELAMNAAVHRLTAR
jgi:hypothetical protein